MEATNLEFRGLGFRIEGLGFMFMCSDTPP